MLDGAAGQVPLTREEVFYCHRGRHPVLMHVKTGVKKDGAITGMHFQSFLDGGAYGSYGVASTFYTGALQTVNYDVPRYKFRGLRAFTNKPRVGQSADTEHRSRVMRWRFNSTRSAEQLKLDPAAMRREKPRQTEYRDCELLRIGSRVSANASIRSSKALTGRIDSRVGIRAIANWRTGKESASRAARTFAAPVCQSTGTKCAVGVHFASIGKAVFGVMCGSIDIGQGSDSNPGVHRGGSFGNRPFDIV